MTVFSALLGSLALIAAMYMVHVLTSLSQRLGAVTKVRPYYRGYYVAQVCLAVALVGRLLEVTTFRSPPQELPAFLVDPVIVLLGYHLSLIVGLTIAIVVTIRYWGWLWHER